MSGPDVFDVLDAAAGYDPNPFSPQGAAQDEADDAGLTWATYEPADRWRLIFAYPEGEPVTGRYRSKGDADWDARQIGKQLTARGDTYAYAIVSPAGVIVSDCRSAGFAGPLPWMMPAE
jgi:hypothetical protein